MRLINFLSFIFFLLAAAIFGVIHFDKSFINKCNKAFDNTAKGYKFMLDYNEAPFFHTYCVIEADDITVIYPIEYSSKWKAKRDRRLEKVLTNAKNKTTK